MHALRENGRLLAELATRCGAAPLAPPRDGRVVRGPVDVAAYLVPEMGGLEQEQLRVVLLNCKNKILRVALVYQGISYTSRETVIDIGPVHATADRQRTLPLPPVLGIAAVAGGVVLLIAGVRKHA